MSDKGKALEALTHTEKCKPLAKALLLLHVQHAVRESLAKAMEQLSPASQADFAAVMMNDELYRELWGAYDGSDTLQPMTVDITNSLIAPVDKMAPMTICELAAAGFQAAIAMQKKQATKGGSDSLN